MKYQTMGSRPGQCTMPTADRTTDPPPPAPPARPWRPGALIVGSMAAHLGGLLLIVASFTPTLGEHPLAEHRQTLIAAVLVTLAANHLLISLTGLWPRSRALGPNLRHLSDIRPGSALSHLILPGQPSSNPFHGSTGGPHLPEAIALTIDDGPDPDVTPRVLELLRRFDARATFFLIGANAVAHPELVRRLLAEGHAIGNHTARHAHDFSLNGPHAMMREIALAQQQLTVAGHSPPRFFRAPAGLRNPFLEPVLCRLGLTLASWTRRGFDTVDRNADRIATRLVGRDGSRWGTRLRAGDILLVHDGHAARDETTGEPVVLAVLERMLVACRDRALAVRSLDELTAPT